MRQNYKTLVILRRRLLARRRTWAHRAKRRDFGDAKIARLVRFLIDLTQPNATDYYSSARFPEFIRYSSFCNPFATSPQYRKVIKLPF